MASFPRLTSLPCLVLLCLLRDDNYPDRKKGKVETEGRCALPRVRSCRRQEEKAV